MTICTVDKGIEMIYNPTIFTKAKWTIKRILGLKVKLEYNVSLKVEKGDLFNLNMFQQEGNRICNNHVGTGSGMEIKDTLEIGNNEPVEITLTLITQEIYSEFILDKSELVEV